MGVVVEIWGTNGCAFHCQLSILIPFIKMRQDDWTFNIRKILQSLEASGQSIWYAKHIEG